VQVFDEEIVARWKTEALAHFDIDMTESMFMYCIDELRHKSANFQATGIVTAYDWDAQVVKSDSIIPSSLKNELRASAALLENVPEARKDWHPGSNGMVLDLVHPSLFPVIYGRTRILKNSVVGLDDCVKRSGEGLTLGVPTPAEAQMFVELDPYVTPEVIMDNPYSRKFQWLPCNIEFDGDKPK
jgi:hypothetical protein